MPSDPRALFRLLMLVFIAMVVTVGLYLLILETGFANIPPRPLGSTKIWLTIVALGMALTVLYVRFSMIGDLLLPGEPIELTQRLAKFQNYYIVCYVISETTALLGFVLRILGGSPGDFAPFFVVAFVLFAACYPRVPMDDSK